MLIISCLAIIAYALVFARGAVFALNTDARRQADNAEVGYIMGLAGIYLVVTVCLWLFEPWKLTNNSPWSALFMGTTVFNAAYYFRRIGALIVGRERRKNERRAEDDLQQRRVRRPPQ